MTAIEKTGFWVLLAIVVPLVITICVIWTPVMFVLSGIAGAFEFLTEYVPEMRKRVWDVVKAINS